MFRTHTLAAGFALAALAFPTLGAQDITPTVGKVELPYSQGKTARLVPPEEKLIEEKSLTFDSNVSAPADPGGDASNGANFYTFVLQPKESLTIRLKAEAANHIGMIAIPPTVKDRMASQFERMARVPKALRSSRFQIENITDKPYTIVLMVHGAVNYWYKMEIERKM